VGVCIARPLLVLVTGSELAGELLAASPLERMGDLDRGSVSVADSALTAQGDKRSTWTRCHLWVVSQRTKAVIGMRNDKIVNGPTHWLNNLRCR